MSLTEEIEIELNKNLPNSNKTIFQNEIDITEPNVIVFITGPHYHATMEKAMNLEKGCLKEVGLNTEKACVDITKITKLKTSTFWTYHPRYISNKSNKLCRDDIINTIMKGFSD